MELSKDHSVLSQVKLEESIEEKYSKSQAFSSVIIRPDEVKRIWKIAKSKNAMLKFYQALYKPKSYEQEKVEYNTINILAEY